MAEGFWDKKLNPKCVCVIILNWNGWQDTIQCLHSLLLSSACPGKVVVCDNGSTDGSPQSILEWVKRRHDINVENQGEVERFEDDRRGISFTLIKNNTNLGYAAGNNKGLRYALSQKRYKYIWLLNNDTKVQRDAFEKLLICSDKFPAGILGSTIIYDSEKNIVQCAGGCTYNSFTTCFRPLYKGQALQDVLSLPYKPKLDYIYGASFFVSTKVFEDCGLLNESFFLFYEEMDFCRRARAAGYKLSWCKESVVIHKGSQSVGISGESSKEKIALANYHENLSTLLYTRLHHRMILPFVMVFRFLGKLIVISLRKEWFLTRPLLKAYSDFWKKV